MAKLIQFFMVLLLVALVSCNLGKRREDVQMQQILEEHAQSVSMGLTGRLASGHQGWVGSKGVPPVHQHLGGHRPCRFGGPC